MPPTPQPAVEIAPAVIEAARLQQRGDLAAAERICRQLLATHQNNFFALHQLGVIHLDRGEYPDAVAAFAAAVEARPHSAEALSNLGLALHAIGKFGEAVLAYDHAIKVNPNHAVAWSNRANSLHELDRHGEAVASSDRAIALAPNLTSAFYNRANALRELGRTDAALADYSRASALDPDNPDIHCNEGLTRLRAGDFRGGWPKYEWRRLRKDNPVVRRFEQPQWTRDMPLAGRTILLHAEQGLGDTIQFSRYLPLVAASGGRIVLEVQPALIPLLTDLAGAATVLPSGTRLPPFDVHCPLMSLPLAFGTEVWTIPADVPYLSAPAARLATWSGRLPRATGSRVALCWSGNPAHNADRHRSIPAERLAPLLAVRNIELISVQKEVRAADQAFLVQAPIADLGAQCHDFADTAAILTLCDLVISVDTSIAHLAGALGRPTWIMLPHSPDFRWLMQRADSPWYPTARLRRQPAPGDWDSVIAQTCRDLAAFLPRP